MTMSTNDYIIEAFPEETEFIVMPQEDWDRLLRYVKGIGLPQDLQDLRVLTVELAP
jgi:hypothetical protein